MDFRNLKYEQLIMFAKEIIYRIDENKAIPVEKICVEIENGMIVEFIECEFGFKNLNTKSEAMPDVNRILEQLYVSEQEAHKCGINNNGLVYILRLIFDQLGHLLFNLNGNNIDTDAYWGAD